ncbi:ubiquitin [Metallosphaera tengchongensis]|uniref:Ubiquitin n=1 Tax=Metallosphaera tengchongensis TaxID=1532350 RepID=A0A6N0NT55_9CREN|nr:ubiquitin [Metallosphaera tengchongensis]QKQ99881.1 ubiquitin [Metallosphaera tengchongensis]
MTKIILKGPLSNIFGREELQVPSGSLIDVLRFIDKTGVLLKGNRIRSGFMVLVNGKDIRLLKSYDLNLGSDDLIEIIPINHGG